MTSRWPLALALALTVACRSAAPAAPPQAPVPPAPAVAPTPAPAALPLAQAIRWARDSAEHRALFLQVYAPPPPTSSARPRAARAGAWAVVLDADETVIDNSLYQLERERGRPAVRRPRAGTAWTQRREAVPLPGAAAFLARVRALGGRIAIVTNRTVSRVPGHRGGLPRPRPRLRRDAVQAGRRARATRTRASRRSRAGTTPAGLPPLEVVAFVGDNIHDFPGLSQAIRNQGDEAFAAFGTRFFALPNPMYGSWEKN